MGSSGSKDHANFSPGKKILLGKIIMKQRQLNLTGKSLLLGSVNKVPEAGEMLKQLPEFDEFAIRKMYEDYDEEELTYFLGVMNSTDTMLKQMRDFADSCSVVTT